MVLTVNCFLIIAIKIGIEIGVLNLCMGCIDTDPDSDFDLDY